MIHTCVCLLTCIHLYINVHLYSVCFKPANISPGRYSVSFSDKTFWSRTLLFLTRKKKKSSILEQIWLLWSITSESVLSFLCSTCYSYFHQAFLITSQNKLEKLGGKPPNRNTLLGKENIRSVIVVSFLNKMLITMCLEKLLDFLCTHFAERDNVSSVTHIYLLTIFYERSQETIFSSRL